MSRSSIGANRLFREASELNKIGKFDEAEIIYRQIILEFPEDNRAHYSLSTNLLARGKYVEGWALYESRTLVPETGVAKPNVSYPEWDGSHVRSLLVFPEQGFGDQIMFCRYIPEVVSRNIRVTLLCPPSLIRIFSNLGANLIPAAGNVQVPAHEAWCLMGSLPHLIGGFASPNYLADPRAGEGIGFCTHGNPRHVNDANRSLPVELREYVRKRGQFAELNPEFSGSRDFYDTAEIIQSLEYVISVDTSVAHLAGAIGKSTRILLPAVGVDWRWGREGNSTLFYPSVRLIRQLPGQNWAELLEQLFRELSL